MSRLAGNGDGFFHGNVVADAYLSVRGSDGGASLFWIIWFPVVYWMLSLFTTLVAFPKVMLKRKRGRARWVSPDRGIGRIES